MKDIFFAIVLVLCATLLHSGFNRMVDRSVLTPVEKLIGHVILQFVFGVFYLVYAFHFSPWLSLFVFILVCINMFVLWRDGSKALTSAK